MTRIWASLCLVFIFSISLCGQTRNPFEIISTQSGESTELLTTTVDTVHASDSIQNIAVSPSIPIADTIAVDTIEAVSKNPFEIRSADELRSIQEEQNISEVNNISESTEVENNKPTIEDAPVRTANKKNNSTFTNFIFWILMISLFILAIVINLKRKTFMNLYRAITNDNYLKLLQREENNGLSFFFILLYVIFFLNASLFLYQTQLDSLNIYGMKPYFMVMLFLIGIYSMRYICMSLLHIVFPLEKEAKQFNFTVIMFNIIIGLLFIPLNVIIAYTGIPGTAIWLGYAFIVFFYLLRQLRGLFIAARTRGINYFHFFIYLCAFEVAPIIWIISIANNWSTNS